MAEINQAYEAKDLAALQRLQDQPDQPQKTAPKSAEELAAEMQAEVIRLDGVIAALERELAELVGSELAKLQLSVSMAGQIGQDLLAELARDLEMEIARIKVQLAALA
jgi:hypothetical protein